MERAEAEGIGEDDGDRDEDGEGEGEGEAEYGCPPVPLEAVRLFLDVTLAVPLLLLRFDAVTGTDGDAPFM